MTELLIFMLTGFGIILPAAVVCMAFRRYERAKRLQKVPVRIDEEYPRR